MGDFKIRLGTSQKQVSIGKQSSPLVKLHKRYGKLNQALEDVYKANVEIEQSDYKRFNAIWAIATMHLNIKYDATLSKFGFTRNSCGEISRMNTTQHTTSTDTVPKMTAEDMTELLERLKKDEPGAIKELESLIKASPDEWLSNVNLLDIAKSEFFSCLAKADPLAKTVLHHRVQQSLDLLIAEAQNPLERLLLEHIQLAILAAQYNHLLLIDNRRSMRERSSLEKRAQEAQKRVREDLWMFTQFKMMANSNWSVGTSDPIETRTQPANWATTRDTPERCESSSQLDEHLTSMVI